MSNELLIALGGAILAVLTYFAGVQRTKKHFEADQSEDRINHVVDYYLKNSQAGRRNGLDGFLKAGAITLKDDMEIRKACQRIVSHGEHSPLMALGESQHKIDLFKFFKLANERRSNFHQQGNIENLIKEIVGAK